MIGFLIIVHTIVSILLISVVLMQASQGGGLSGNFGGRLLVVFRWARCEMF